MAAGVLGLPEIQLWCMTAARQLGLSEGARFQTWLLTQNDTKLRVFSSGILTSSVT